MASLENVVSQISKNHNMQNWKYICTEFDVKLNNYLGDIIPITVNDEDTGETLHLVIKKAPEEHELKEIGNVSLVYNTETYVYSEFLPKLSILDVKNTKNLFPKSYYTDNSYGEEVIVSQDMRTEGFLRVENLKFLDYKHAVIALEALGKFHGVCMVAQAKQIKFDDNVLKPHSVYYPQYYIEIIKGYSGRSIPIMKGTKHEKFMNIIPLKFDKFLSDTTEKVKKLLYGHGDFWRENILYKYANNEPTEACLIDFQLTRLLSPAEDILYFLTTSIDSSVRREYFNEFLSIYWKSVERILSEHSLNASDIYSQEDLQHDLKVVAPYSFIRAVIFYTFWGEKKNDLNIKDYVTDVIDDLDNHFDLINTVLNSSD